MKQRGDYATFKFQPLPRRHPGRNQKLVVSLSDSGFGSDDFGGQVDFDDRRARVKHDVVLTVPTERVDENLAGLLRAAQDAGEQDPVVVPIGFVAEHHNVELITAATKQDFLYGAGTCHAVADDHEPEFGHVSPPRFTPPDQISTRPTSITTYPVVPAGAPKSNSSFISGQRSSTTASGTCVPALAPTAK